MKWFRNNRKGSDAVIDVGDASKAPRISAIIAWTLAHEVPYSYVTAEFLEDVYGNDEPQRRHTDAEAGPW
jgi:hypothetical protein